MRSLRPGFAALLILSFGTGATDAFAFLNLNGVFTANMTGNLVLIGLLQRPGYLAALAPIIAAVLSFAGTAYLGFRVTRPSGGQHRATVLVLAAAAAAQLVVLTGWLPAGSTLTTAAKTVLVVFSAAAMACQTVVARRLAAQSGVTTTFVTGTVTSLAQDLSDGTGGARSVRIAAIGFLVAGAFCSAAALAIAPWSAAILPALAALVAIPFFVVDRAHH